MKNSIIFFLTLSFLASCEETSSDQIIGKDKVGPIIYRSNSPTIGANNSITLNYTKGIVTAERTYGPLKAEDPNSMIYFHTEVNTIATADGSVLITDDKGDLWFIPFMVSTEPVLISSDNNKCITYYCTCGGFPSQVTAGCQEVTSPTSLHCGIANSELCASSCLGYAIEGPCNAFPTDLSKTYTGGVFVRAGKVKVIDPPGYEADKKAKGTKYFVHPDGGLIAYDEAVKLNFIQPSDSK